jgi:hypothetical protein
MLMLLGSDALAKKRIALLIGNKGYKAGVGALRNPLNDIREALRIVGFEVPKPANFCVEILERSKVEFGGHDALPRWSIIRQ